MAIYRIVINTDNSPDREAGLQKVVEDYNVSIEIPPDSELPPETSTPLTVEQYLQRVLDIAVDSYSQAALKARGETLSKKFAQADDATRASVEGLLDSFPEASKLSPNTDIPK